LPGFPSISENKFPNWKSQKRFLPGSVMADTFCVFCVSSENDLPLTFHGDSWKSPAARERGNLKTNPINDTTPFIYIDYRRRTQTQAVIDADVVFGRL
jgi:hypothetical protein